MMEQDDIIARWPDGTWCAWDELEQYLQFMSDDFEKQHVLTWDEAYCPLTWERVK